MTANVRIAVVSRGDPLTSYLHEALAARYDLVADIDAQLRGWRRAWIAGQTVRPTWTRWSESYIKSVAGYRMRSRLAERRLDALEGRFDVALQTHALFDTGRHPSMIYVDCTYQQAIEGWPDWTSGSARHRARWLRHEGAAYRRAVHLFTFSDEARDSLVEGYGVDSDRVTVVGAGANVTQVEDAGRVHADAPSILFVGRDFERKGGPMLLRAFATLRRSIPEARLRIVGCRPEGAIPDGVEVLGAVDDRRALDELYAGSDIFCLPSSFDPGGLVVLEAMAHGLPTVVTRDAARLVHDLVDDCSGGIMIETGMEGQLVQALSTLVDDPLRARRMGEHARRAVLTDRLWSGVVDRMAPALERAGRDRSAPAAALR